jgi:transposase
MPRAKKQRGRKPDASSKSGKVRELLKAGMSATEIAQKVGCTTGLVYNVKARMGGAKKGGRRTGRPSGRATAQIDGLASILEAVKGAERERAQLRAVLEKLQSVIADALA